VPDVVLGRYSGGVISILLAGAFFVGIHLFVAGTSARDRIVGVIGERGYQGAFSLLSLGGIIWLCRAWAGAEPMAPIWSLPALRPVVLVLMLIAFLFVAVGLTTPSPTATGGERTLDSDEPARGILRITRHPFLWGVALWGFCHLLVNADPPALLFFGALLTLALYGPISIDNKRRRKFGERWQRFEDVTSNVPFAAIASGRNQLRLGELGVFRLALGVGLFLLLLGFHARLFGANPLPL
jgi:uncharacterized membrane protein